MPVPEDIQLPTRHEVGLCEAISEGTPCEQEAHEEGEPFHFEKREIVTVREFNRGGFISGLQALQFPPETVLAL